MCIITMENKNRKSLGGSIELRKMVYQRQNLFIVTVIKCSAILNAFLDLLEISFQLMNSICNVIISKQKLNLNIDTRR